MTINEILNQAIIDTEDFMMYHNLIFGWLKIRVENVLIVVETDYKDVRFTIGVANNIDIPVYQTWDFEDAIEAAYEAHELSMQFVQF